MMMETRAVTAFEQRVYDAICKIPVGRVTTYKSLAKRIDCGSSQAVGQALKRNPNAPEVACHRVINSQLKIAGYMGKTDGEEIQRKRDLLASEGVDFDKDGKLVDAKRVVDAW